MRLWLKAHMHRIKAALLFICCITTLISCHEEPYTGRHWVRYYARDKQYSINMPAGSSQYNVQVTYDELNQKFPEHSIFWRYPSSWIPDMDVKAFCFEYIELPEKNITGEAADKWLRISMNRFMGQFKEGERKEIVIKNVAINNYKGISIVGEWKEEGKVVFCNKYVAGNRIYTLWVSAFKSKYNQKEVDEFLNSLKIPA